VIDLSAFHFAQPAWLLALPVPGVFALARRWARRRGAYHRIEAYADPHLLPHLIRSSDPAQGSRGVWWRWSLLWILGLLALAGPRWGYQDIAVTPPHTELVVVLDLSRSMDATDVRPSRLARARQEIQDLLDAASEWRVGLLAFASVPYLVVPLTEDTRTLTHLLPSVSTDLARWSGSRLAPALERAGGLLRGQRPGTRKAVLVISDGDFGGEGAHEQVVALAAEGIVVHTLGVGTRAGAEVPNGRGGVLRVGGDEPVRSALQPAVLESLAETGGGVYRQADFRGDDTAALQEALAADGITTTPGADTRRVWREEYGGLVALMLLLLWPWVRGRAAPREAR